MDCSRNSSRQPGCWPSRSSVSESRNIALAGPGSSAPIASHGCSAPASASSSPGSASNRPSGAVSAVSQASWAGTCFGRRPRRDGSRSIPAGNVVRTAASAKAYSAEMASSWPSWVSGSARHTGGIAAISAFKATTSGPCTTGRQNATGPCSSQESAGRTRPRSTSPRANAASSARYATDSPYRTSAAGSSSAVSADAAGRDITGTVQGNRTGSILGAGRGVTRNSSGESSGDFRNDGNNRTAVPSLPVWIGAMASASAANGCGRAARNASLGLVTASAESSAHRHSPFAGDQNPCRTNIDVSPSSDAARLTSEGKHAQAPRGSR